MLCLRSLAVKNLLRVLKSVTREDEKYTFHKRGDMEHRHPKKENLQYQNQSYRVYHKFWKKQNH